VKSKKTKTNKKLYFLKLKN